LGAVCVASVGKPLLACEFSRANALIFVCFVNVVVVAAAACFVVVVAAAACCGWMMPARNGSSTAG
jgi:hypothetical protein